ncbi:hypothetical protein X773_09745 [Mesorhizobium sp. LSJC285A00]|nr:hypothetical protein X773_09745 [Mesorhizobium sp. LSJC285A00]ESW85024.1 hypothetical protein X770_23355 [Mesorhizobium sp. LSJC269B00]ESX46870.1 hypothetical protein X762_20005 [Mesorhizobium sp. LSHC426A00]ESX59236.1 hypothetical protein X761_00340 [Mesorhizobium sp. LSHC424B00]ESX72310.1 hypothetical protein X758_12750 [Mesorhizobium sp. LSHC416B00]
MESSDENPAVLALWMAAATGALPILPHRLPIMPWRADDICLRTSVNAGAAG